MGTSSAVRSVALRLEVQGDDVVVRKLDQVGKGGESAMGRLKNSSREVPGYLKAVSTVSSGVKDELGELGGRAGLAGRALMAIGPVGVGVAATLGSVALAANAAFSKTREAMEFSDAIEQQSKRLKIGTENLQAWQAAAVDADVSADSLAGAFVLIKQKSDEYVAGLMRSKEARPFQLLGISREDMALAEDAEKKLLLIAGALEKVDANQREGIIEKLGLGEIGPLLEGGRANLEKMLAAAKSNGQVLSETVTKPLAEANKESDKLSKKISNDWARALQGLAPVMDWFQRRWGEIASTIAGALNPSDDERKEKLKAQIAAADAIIKSGGKAWYNTDAAAEAQSVENAKKARARAQAELDGLNRVPLQPFHVSVEAYVKAGLLPKSALKLPPTAEELAKAEEDRKRAEAEAKRRAEEQRRLQEQRTAFIDRLGQVEASADREATVAQARANADKLRGKAGYYQAVADMIRVTADAEVKEIEAAAQTELDQLKKLEDAFKKAGLAVPDNLASQQKTIERIKDKKVSAVRERQGQDAADNAKEARGELGHLIDQLSGPLDEAMNNAAAHGLQSFSDALVSIATGAADAGAAVKKMAASIIADLARIVINKTIVAPVGNWLSGAVSKAGDFLSGWLGGGHAAGGPVSAGVVYPVNEKGFELLQTRQDSYVLDHSKSMTNVAAAVAKQIQPSVVVTQSAPQVKISNYGEPIVVQKQKYDPKSNTLSLDFRRGLRQEISNSVSDGDLDPALGARFNATPTVKRRM
jgi:hypothetical protein